MIRRRHKAETRFDARHEPVTLANNEYASLLQIERGGVSKARMRERLLSKGLVTSKVGSKCAITRKGRASLNARALTRDSDTHRMAETERLGAKHG